MKRKIIITLLLFFTLIANSQVIKYVYTNELNIREGAGSKYKVITKAFKNDKVTVLSEQGKWSEVKLNNGIEGYASTKFLFVNENSSTLFTKENCIMIGYFTILGLILYFLNKISKFFGLGSIFNSSSKVKNKTKSKSYTKTISKQTKRNKTYFSPKMELKYYCKHCGYSMSSIKNLISNTCSKSPTKYHSPYEGQEKNKYYCEYCGYSMSSIKNLTSNTCFKSPTKYHSPFIGQEKNKYDCKYCGYSMSSIMNLTSNTCSKSPTKKHHPAI